MQICLILLMSRIFQTQNQFVIRFPEHIAALIQQYLESPETNQMPEIDIELDKQRKDISHRIALKVHVNQEQHFKATVMDLPTISSTFKTLDRINFFKSNDISEMILVHQNEDECENIYREIAQRITDREEKKTLKYKCQSGLTTPSKFIRQQNFKQKPDIDRFKVSEVDKQMQRIRFNASQVKQKQKQQAKQKKEKMGYK